MSIQISPNSSFSPADALNQQLSVDPRGLSNLQAQAAKDPKGAARAAASQFEAMFVNTLLQQMRATHFDEEGETNDMGTYRGMLDQQLTQNLSKAGGMGLGDMLYRQIARQSGFEPEANPRSGGAPGPQLSVNLPLRALQAYQQTQPAKPAEAAAGSNAPAASPLPADNRGFVRALLPHANAAAQQLGVAPEYVVAHAALESGWGKRAIRHPDGSDSHNLFGIKAGGDWKGRSVAVLTTEYVNGAPQKRVENFRAYGSYAEAFSDYARLLKDSPRYSQALNQGRNVYGFAQGLQSGGYATDPRYARKLVDVAAALTQKV